jgi:LPS-assembly protein
MNHRKNVTTRLSYPVKWVYTGSAPLPIFMFIFVVLFSATFSWGKTEAPDLPWQIFADHVNYDKNTQYFTADGNVTLVQGNRKITADRIRYRTDTLMAEAAGHVVVTVGDDILTGDRMELDLSRETGMIHNGRVFFKARHFHINGNQIEKTGAKTYRAKKASITTCNGNTPDWKITGRNINLAMQGYATAWHTTLWIKNFPVFYTPYLVIPIKQRRQSGFLPPEFVVSDSRNGFGYTQPLFWAISPNTDATFYWQYLENRGNKWGAEFRYILDPRSRGTMMFDYLDDRQVDDGTGDSSDQWGYTHDDQLRPNKNRYWFRMKHDQETLPWGLTAKIDLDIVSDQDYLLEFKGGLTGFDASDEYFHDTFGRDLDDYNETVRRNIINISRTWSKFRLNTGATWYDNVIRRRFSDQDPTIQQLPWVTFNGSKQKIFKTPLFYTLDTKYIHYYRKDSDINSDITRLHEAEWYPRLFLPIKAGRFFTIEPSAGWRYNYWYISASENEDVDQKTSFDRNIYDIGTRFSSELYRVYQIGGTRIDKIKHTIRPQFFYEYTPEVNQDDLPNFSPIKPIEKKNVVTYTLISSFTSKLKKTNHLKRSTVKSNASTQPPNYDYREFLRLFLSQSYDFNEANNDIDDPKPLSPLFGEIRFHPSPYLWAKADMKWDTYENDYLEKNAEASIRDKRGDRFQASYRIKGDQQEHLKFYLYALITNRLSTHAQYERDMIAKKDVKRGWGWQYRADCWTFSLDYLEEADDQRYAFSISLHGLGGIRHGFGGNIGGGD